MRDSRIVLRRQIQHSLAESQEAGYLYRVPCPRSVAETSARYTINGLLPTDSH